MPPRLAKLALTAHVTASVGWVGAVIAFLALAVSGMTSRDAQTVQAAYLTMELTAWFVILPLAFASLLTGLVQGLGTAWGVFRHYWVVFKLVINVLATIVLLVYMRTLGFLAGVAAEMAPPGAVPGALRSPTAVLHSGAALVLLLVAVTLSVYKPRGLTPHGQRKQRRARQRARHGADSP